MTVEDLLHLKESEHKIEFKSAKGGNYSYNGGGKPEPRERRKCILGYVTAFANEGGGRLVFGIADRHPHDVVGTNQCIDATGQLKSDIYRDTKIRVEVHELFDSTGKRVVVIEIPSRPKGKVFKFEDVPLMRVGEELVPMSDEKYREIINEQDPDYSEHVCEGVLIEDLDEIAIQKMKEAYAKKHNNPIFLTANNYQILSDLELVQGTKVTIAAVVLLGKKEVIRKVLPQASIILEYRTTDGQIIFDNRIFFQEPYYIAIDKLWNAIDARNGNVPVQQGPYMFEIPYFNKEVIREAINNAVSHRDYRLQSEIVIKQYPQCLHIINPGGFPIGVNLKNLLTISSTPRNRRLADVLQKTGIVERAGQGIGKIFYQCLSEAKDVPDYSASDDYQVDLKVSAVVKDKAFALFINQIQKDRKPDEKLSVQEIMCLERIREGADKAELDNNVTSKLLKEGLIEKIGKTRNQNYRLPKSYYSFTNKTADYTISSAIDSLQASMIIHNHLEQFSSGQMKDFVRLLENFLNREQVKYMVYELVNKGILERKGRGKGTEYSISKKAKQSKALIAQALEYGLEEMRKRGEWSHEKEA